MRDVNREIFTAEQARKSEEYDLKIILLKTKRFPFTCYKYEYFQMNMAEQFKELVGFSKISTILDKFPCLKFFLMYNFNKTLDVLKPSNK